MKPIQGCNARQAWTISRAISLTALQIVLPAPDPN